MMYPPADHPEWTPSILKMVWRGWLKFAHVVGTIQMVIILTLVYWIMLSIMALDNPVEQGVSGYLTRPVRAILFIPAGIQIPG